MEDIVEEPITDIDSGDADNHLAAVDYVEELYGYYRKMEVHGILLSNEVSCGFRIFMGSLCLRSLN